jgi:hypothetical protein
MNEEGSLQVRSASLLLERLGIERPDEIDVEAIAQACGATIVYEPLGGCEARLVGLGGRAIITVNTPASRERQRFSAAHELGHWMYDRGRIAFACAEGQLVGEWGKPNPERRANRFAADLLLPRNMFKRVARERALTLGTARDLASTFQTSLTATVIRLVELSGSPALAACHDARGRRWLVTSDHLPEQLITRDTPRPASLAARLMQGASLQGPAVVPASAWSVQGGDHFGLVEDSTLIGQGLVLSLVWWKDQAATLAAVEARDADLH